MFAAPLDLVATSLFGLTCFAAGILLMVVLRRWHRSLPWAPRRGRLDRETNELIDRYAQDWASTRGTPWAADIAAPYAKMLARLRVGQGGDQPW